MSTLTASQPETLLAQAGTAFSRGDLEAARHFATQASKLPQARHLLALVERRSGNREAARAHFQAALSALPDDPAIQNNFANLLVDLGEPEAALGHYRRAIGIKPDYFDALTNLGLQAKNLGYFDEARDALERATKLAPTSAKAWQLLALLLRDLGEMDSSVQAFDRAQQLAPQDVKIAHGRAMAEMDRGGDSLPLFDRALTLDPGNLPLALGKASAMLSQGDPEGATAMLAELVERHPDWQQGHLVLTQLRWQVGEGLASARSYDEALAKRPGDMELMFGKLSTLHRARRYAEVVTAVEAMRRTYGHDPSIGAALDQFEAVASDECGDTDRAAALFPRLLHTRDHDLLISYTRHLLRVGRPDEAARQVQAVLAETRSRLAWAYLATAWRLTGDPQWEWLEGDPRFIASIDIEEIAPHLPALAERLRELHVLRVHPFDQSLVGGTQTDGHLLVRSDPDIRRLREGLERAVGAYIAQLPPHDPRHPLLGEPRERGFRFAGSWSVRLSSQGFHINHVHPAGWISSAFYVALPPTIGDETNPAGWLQLGVPSAELGLDLQPIHLIEPRPGRLALFPSTMWHGTLPFDDGERLTVAFDVTARSR